MTVDLKKWKQRNAAERVKAALTRPKKDLTAERLRRQFSATAEKAMKALNAKGSNAWLRYGFNGDVVVTAKLANQIIPVTGDESIALQPDRAEAYLKDVAEAAKAGQLDRQLLAAAAEGNSKGGELKLKSIAVVDSPKPKNITLLGGAPATVSRAPIEVGLQAER